MATSRLRGLLAPVLIAGGVLLTSCGGSGSGGVLPPTSSVRPSLPPRDTASALPSSPEQTTEPSQAAPTRSVPPRTQPPQTQPPQTQPPQTQPPPTSEPTQIVVTTAPAATATSASPAATPSPTPTPTTTETSDNTGRNWLIFLLIVAAIAIATALILARRRRTALWDNWRRQAAGALEGARLAYSVLPASSQPGSNDDQWQQARTDIDRAAQALDEAATSAPNSDANSRASEAARTIRAAALAHESVRLLYSAATPPTAGQLAEADAAVRSARTAADQALTQLDELVRRAPSPPPTTSPPG